MKTILRSLTLVSLMAAAVSGPSLAEDAMATDAMAGDAMASHAMMPAAPRLTDAELEQCLSQAAAITFHDAMMAATAACRGLHQGMDVLGAIQSLGMDVEMMAPAMATDAMSSDAMATDAMASDAMAPAQ